MLPICEVIPSCQHKIAPQTPVGTEYFEPILARYHETWTIISRHENRVLNLNV